MSESITIQGTVIDFPSSSESPNWAEPVIQFAEAVESALTTVVGPDDIAAQVYTMPLNVNAATSISGLQFSTSTVRSAYIRYAVYRTADSGASTAYEAGLLNLVYNVANASSQKWEMSREGVGDGSITFTILDTGQVQFATTQVGTTNHVGKISFVAQALEQA